ncbi:MAG TPA: hypothetical protein VMZ27_08855 [Candidatus Saccharimonadales bacterium]|nr:hypothetical protein [Candidatus Saccharimonadales bacterium]
MKEVRSSFPNLLPLQLCALVLWLCGCGPQSSDNPRGLAQTPSQQQHGFGSSSSGTRNVQARFLNDIRQADPAYKTIQKAVLNENNELGLVLSRNVEMDAVPALIKSVLTRMAHSFPSQDLTVIVYAPASPPLKIGEGHLDARTRQMSYTPARNYKI